MKIKLPAQEMDIETLEKLIAEAKKPQPVEGQVYRHKDSPAGGPFLSFWFLRRFERGRWEWKPPDGEWAVESSGDALILWRDGSLVPYIPPVSSFKVGDWVVSGTRTRKVSLPGDGHVIADGMWYSNREIRLATADEIAAATRIMPAAGVLLKRKADGYVFLLSAAAGTGLWHKQNLTKPHPNSEVLGQFGSAWPSTEHYDILDSYTIHGVK